jgi:uncharacterized membrane protein
MPHALDKKLERLVSRTLKAGLAASSALMVLGFVLAVFAPPWSEARWQLDWLRTQPLVALLAQPAFALTLGILILMLTPVLRVLMTLMTFVIERDWRYVAISATVLLVLAISIVIATIE